jgi:hypothetical protein
VIENRASENISGRSIFSEEWDVCILLDACRIDELSRQSDSYDWLEEIGHFPSVASCTWDWMPRTFSDTRFLSETDYLTANPFSDTFCDADEFHTLDEIWKYAWDENQGTVLPRPVTDRAIRHGRNNDAERLLVHYIQPHVPFLVEESKEISKGNFEPHTESDLDDWDRVTRGELSRDRAINWYRQSLIKVLDEVELLLSNIEAEKVVISADHGEAFGESGIYGHPSDIDLSCLTQVPWVETSARNEETHNPKQYSLDSGEVPRDEQLRALGYQ